MAKEGLSRAAMESMQQLIKKRHAEVQEENQRGAVFPGHNELKSAIEWHPVLVRENHTDGCLPCQDGTWNNRQTRWRRNGTGAPPPGPAPPRPRMPPAPPDDSESNRSSEAEGVPPRYLCIHTPLPRAQLFNLDPYAKDRMRDKDFIPDLLTDEGPSRS